MERIIGYIPCWLALILALMAIPACGGDDAASPGHMPALQINTHYDPFTVPRDFWHEGTISLEGAAEGHNFEGAQASIRGRGNSTWWNGADKRPLRFRFGEAMPLLGSGHAATDWILLANHFDRSLLRNYAALHLSGLLSGMDFTPMARHLHLYVNGEYMGVYLLTDERDVNPGRMELLWNSDPGASDFFLELDARAYQSGTENQTFVNVNGLLYDVRFPASAGRTPEHMAYVKAYIKAVSSAIRSQNFEEALLYIDLASFLDFYIVQEIFRNPDVHVLSVFMSIQGAGDERRLHMGPVWDFDTSAGNEPGRALGAGPQNLYVGVFNYWYRYLMGTPEFADAVAERWNEIRDAEIAQTIEHLQSIAARYRDEFERNFERHQIMGVAIVSAPQEILEIDSFMGHVDFLTSWLNARVDWLDDFFNGRMAGHDPLWALVNYHAHESPINIVINHELQHFSTPPIMLQERTMLSLEEIGAALNLSVYYEPQTGAILLEKDGIAISHQMGATYLVASGAAIEIGTPFPLSIGGHIFVPLRGIAEALGYEIFWQEDTRTVHINF